MKYLAIIAFSLLTSAISSLAESAKELPDFSKAFPEEDFFSQGEAEKDVKAYLYASDLGFDDLKLKFTKFIGEGWEEIEIDEDTQAEIDAAMTHQNLIFSGAIVFTSKSFPEIEIALTQVERQINGRSSLVTIVVDERNRAEPNDPDNPVNPSEYRKNHADD